MIYDRMDGKRALRRWKKNGENTAGGYQVSTILGPEENSLSFSASRDFSVAGCVTDAPANQNALRLTELLGI